MSFDFTPRELANLPLADAIRLRVFRHGEFYITYCGDNTKTEKEFTSIKETLNENTRVTHLISRMVGNQNGLGCKVIMDHAPPTASFIATEIVHPLRQFEVITMLYHLALKGGMEQWKLEALAVTHPEIFYYFIQYRNYISEYTWIMKETVKHLISSQSNTLECKEIVLKTPEIHTGVKTLIEVKPKEAVKFVMELPQIQLQGRRKAAGLKLDS